MSNKSPISRVGSDRRWPKSDAVRVRVRESVCVFVDVCVCVFMEYALKSNTKAKTTRRTANQKKETNNNNNSYNNLKQTKTTVR